MTNERFTAIVLIALTWGRTEALSMLVSFAARRTHSAPRAALSRATRQGPSNTRSHRGIQATPQHQQPVRLRRGGSAWAMSTTSKGAASAVDSLPGPTRFVCLRSDSSQVQLVVLSVSRDRSPSWIPSHAYHNAWQTFSYLEECAGMIFSLILRPYRWRVNARGPARVSIALCVVGYMMIRPFTRSRTTVLPGY